MRNARSPLEKIETAQLLRSWAVSLVCGTVLGWIVLMFSGIGLFALLSSFFYGTSMAYAVAFFTSHKRGRMVEIMAAGSTIGGLALAVLLSWGIHGLLAQLASPWFLIMVAVAGYTAYNRARYF